MAFCTKCGAQIPDGTGFCPSCGAVISAPEAPHVDLNKDSGAQAQAPQQPQSQYSAPQQYQQPGQQQFQQPGQQQFQQSGQQFQQPYQQQYQQYNNAAPNFDNFDHTSEFDAKDISDNKVMAMLVYLLDVFGVILALLAGITSPYAAFHVRQALKFTVLESLTAICMGLLFWTIIVPIAGGIFLIVLWVVKIICFFQVCSGTAKEPPIIRSFKFLK